MKRRDFIRSCITTGAAVSMSGCAGVNRSTLTPKISIFMGDNLSSHITDLGLKPRDYCEVVRDYIDNQLRGLSTEQVSVEPKIKIGTTKVNQHKVKNAHHESKLGNWDDSLSRFVDEENISRDSNLLLARGISSGSYTGFGEYPTCCNTPTSIVFDVDPSFVGVPDTIKYSHPCSTRLIALHEVCHNLGLKHNVGSIELNHEINEVIGTPMTMGHIHDLVGGTNYFGESYPKDIPEDYGVTYKTNLNNRIKPRQLQIGGVL